MSVEPQRPVRKRETGRWARDQARALSWELKRWSYVDLGGGPEDTVFIAGSGRSGTTWVEEVVNRNRDHRIMFEPFWSRHVPALRAFAEHQYLRSGTTDSRYVDPVARILSGQVRNRWIDHHNTVRLPRKRLVKEIRANNWLGWAADLWPEMTVVFIIRHPMAVVSSGDSLGWGDGLDRILAQPQLLSDHFDEDTQQYLSSLADPWERSIARWCVENMVPFRTLGPTRATLVVYEALASHSDDEVDRLLAAVDQTRDGSLAAAFDQPSRLARAGSLNAGSTTPTTAWVDKVDATRRRRGIAVIERLGFGNVYNDEPRPNADAAHHLWSQANPRSASTH